jgi:hypothetical protein
MAKKAHGHLYQIPTGTDYGLQYYYSFLKDLIEFARKNPGKVTYTISGSLNPMHLAMMYVAKQAMSLLPHRPEIHNMAGQVYFRGNNLMKALHAFEKSLEIEKANIDAFVGDKSNICIFSIVLA